MYAFSLQYSCFCVSKESFGMGASASCPMFGHAVYCTILMRCDCARRVRSGRKGAG